MSGTTTSPATAGHSIDDIESICEAYCPPLEAGLVYAIASDFDLSNPQDVKQLQSALNELRVSAVVEQDLELLPQGNVIDNRHEETPRSEHGESHNTDVTSSQHSRKSPHSANEEDTVTSVSTGVSGLRISDVDGSDSGYALGYGDAGANFDDLSDDERCKYLCHMFPNVKLSDVRVVLARCKGNFERSTDELLNISFLEENGADHGNQEFNVAKGVDGFMLDEARQAHRKPKGKGRKNKSRMESRDLSDAWASDSAVSSGAATPNIWKDMPEDVEFIASRTNLKIKTITSVYHANGAHLAPAIRALAIREGESYAKAPQKVDTIVELQMDELRLDYGHVSDAQIYGVLLLARMMPGAAKELLDAMISSNEQPVLLGKVTGLATYTPINLSEDEHKPKKSMSAASRSLIPASSGLYTTSHLANAHGVAATDAFQQASAAYRRGKSDHLMGGAAAYYASVGHERIKAAKSIQATAADAHVAAQSSSGVLDLHGVNVSDAVRIAQQGTEAWWENLGDRKYVVGGKGDGYRIVTGVGRHSADGKGRIGPAVSKMLVREGWRVEVGRGEIVVSGRARR